MSSDENPRIKITDRYRPSSELPQWVWEEVKRLEDEFEAKDKEIEHLKEYRNHIFEYVQGTGATKDKYLGFHLAEAIVNDHKDLKQENQSLRARVALLEMAVRTAHEDTCDQYYLNVLKTDSAEKGL